MEAYKSRSFHSANAGTRVGEKHIFRPSLFFRHGNMDDCVYDYHLHDDGLGKV